MQKVAVWLDDFAVQALPGIELWLVREDGHLAGASRFEIAVARTCLGGWG